MTLALSKRVEREIFNVKDMESQEFHIFHVVKGTGFGIERCLIDDIVKLQVDFIIDGVDISCHLLVQWVEDPVRGTKENAVTLCANFDSHHEDGVEMRHRGIGIVLFVVIGHTRDREGVELNGEVAELTFVFEVVLKEVIEKLVSIEVRGLCLHKVWDPFVL